MPARSGGVRARGISESRVVAGTRFALCPPYGQRYACLKPTRGHTMSDDYQRRSYGDTPVGFGQKPGIVVVDFMVAFTDPKYPLGGAPLVLRAFDNTVKLLEVARRYNVPVASCNTAYMNEREMPYWKISAVRDTFLHDHPSAPIDPRVHDPSYDLTVCKKGSSIFFNTGVA